MKYGIGLIVAGFGFLHGIDDLCNEISIEIKIKCPDSLELQEFIASIPTEGSDSSDFDSWKYSFIKNMTQLMHLVESEKISDASFDVGVIHP